MIPDEDAVPALPDQQRARRRATLYFALREVARAPAAADEAWTRLKAADAELAAPLATPLVGQLGLRNIDPTALMRATDRVAAGLRELENSDVVLERGEPGYPRLLAATADAPPFLFVRGNVELLELPAIAVVGAREASDEGGARAHRLARLLAKRGIAVASGLARGIDTAAHRGALDAGGITIAVIGTPLTRSYPSENAELQRRIGHAGAVVSQFAPSSKTQPHCFPLRNATMSALTLGTVVVEAAERSGSLSQARKALEQGRGLFIPRSAFENRALYWSTKARANGGHVFATVDELVDRLPSKHCLTVT